GFVKEALSIAAWIGALITAIYAFPHAAPFAEKFLPKGMISDLAAGAAVFLATLIVLSIVSSAIARRVKESSMSAIDRTMGLLFGLLRGFVVACLLYLGVTWAFPEASRPEWIKEARSAPILDSGATTLKGMLPPSLRSRAEATAAEAAQKLDQARQADGAMRALSTPKPPETTDPDKKAGPTDSRRDMKRDMDRLFQQNSQ